MKASSENKCKDHPKLENDAYCTNCKSLLCVMCAIAHKKSHPDHQIDTMLNVMLSIGADIDQIDPTIIAEDLVQAEMTGAEEQLKNKLFELTKITESVKIMVMKCVDEWAKPQLDKIIKDLEEYAAIKNQMRVATEFSQKKEKMLESMPELYAERKFQEIIRMKESLHEIKENSEKSKGAKEKVKAIQERNKKLRITFVKEAMDYLNAKITKTLSPFLLLAFTDVCSKCSVELKDISEINKCGVCLNNDVMFCKNCIQKCGVCDKNCCQKCVKPCSKCNQNIVCLKCKDEPCKACDAMKNTFLTKEEWKKLSNLHGKEIKVKSLLFKASRDGFNRKAFHDRCDNKGSTITVVKSQFNQVFGGYANTSWDSASHYIKSSKNFIFSISMNKIFREKENQSEQLNEINYGPWFDGTYFGIGNYKDNWNTDSCACVDYSSSSGRHFESSHPCISGSNNEHFSVKEVEVFQVEI